MSESFECMISLIDFGDEHVEDEVGKMAMDEDKFRPCAHSSHEMNRIEGGLLSSDSEDASLSQQSDAVIYFKDEQSGISLIKNCMKTVPVSDLVWAPTRLKHPKGGKLYAPARICKESEVKLCLGLPVISQDSVPVEFFGLPILTYSLHYSRAERKRLRAYNFKRVKPSPDRRPIMPLNTLSGHTGESEGTENYRTEEWSEELIDSFLQGLRSKWYQNASLIMSNVFEIANEFLRNAVTNQQDSNSTIALTDLSASSDSESEHPSTNVNSASKLLKFQRMSCSLREKETITAGHFVAYNDQQMGRRVMSKVLAVLSAEEDARHPLRLQSGYLLERWDSCRRLVTADSAQDTDGELGGLARPLLDFDLKPSALQGELTFEKRMDASAALVTAIVARETDGYSLNRRRLQPDVGTPPRTPMRIDRDSGSMRPVTGSGKRGPESSASRSSNGDSRRKSKQPRVVDSYSMKCESTRPDVPAANAGPSPLSSFGVVDLTASNSGASADSLIASGAAFEAEVESIVGVHTAMCSETGTPRMPTSPPNISTASDNCIRSSIDRPRGRRKSDWSVESAQLWRQDNEQRDDLSNEHVGAAVKGERSHLQRRSRLSVASYKLPSLVTKMRRDS